jgi:hypothetical protein
MSDSCQLDNPKEKKKNYVGVIINLKDLPNVERFGDLTYDIISLMKGSFTVSVSASSFDDAYLMLQGLFFYYGFSESDTIWRFKEYKKKKSKKAS